jgi:hypothetical protein
MRRDGRHHQDNGPTWEGGPPNSGSNSTHVAGARRAWKRIASRAERRTDGASVGGFHSRKPRGTNELCRLVSEADVTASSKVGNGPQFESGVHEAAETTSRCGGDEQEHEVGDESGEPAPQDH